MGTDYNLKKIYEQMLQGKNCEPSTPQKPRTLNEAYKHILSERAAFFVKEVDPETDEKTANQTSDTSLKPLGVINNSKQVENAIKSYTISSSTKTLMELGGWEEENPLLTARQLAEQALHYDVDPADLDNIAANRQKLNGFATVLNKTDNTFSLINEIIGDIKEYVTLKSKEENIKRFFEWLIKKSGKATEKGDTIGPGEIAITLFTNSKKPQGGGDLSFTFTDAEDKTYNSNVEVKSSGAVLGYSNYSYGNLKIKIQDSIPNFNSSAQSFNRVLSKTKGDFLDYINDLKAKIKGDESSNAIPAYVLFTDELLNALVEIKNAIGTTKIDDVLKKTHFDELISLYNPYRKKNEAYVRLFEKYKFLNNKTENVQLGNISFEQLKNQQTEIIHNIISNILVFKRKGAEKQNKEVSFKEFTSKSWTTSVQDFFLTDLGIDADTMAEIFFEARPEVEAKQKDLLQKIKDILKPEVMESLAHGRTEVLKRILFALHLSEYATHHNFQYLLLIRKDTGNAYSIPIKSGFDDLYNAYPTVEKFVEFTINIGRNGAYKVELK